MDVCLEVDDELDEDQKLWRYMDLAKLVSMLESNSLWLARADTFRDAHEGRFPSEMREFIDKAYEGFDENDPSPVKDTNDFQDYLIKNTFISCWHKNLEENMVMWEIYGRNSNSVAIQTTVKRLSDCIDTTGIIGHSLLLKNVKYQNADAIRGVLLYEECFFRKRTHFAFEQEVRLSLDTYSRENPTKNNPFGINVPLPALKSIFIAKVLVHPDSQQWFVDAVESLMKAYEVHAHVARGIYGND